MARPLRIEYPGAYYHVMNRGNNAQKIFITDKDRSSFVEALRESAQLYGSRVIALVLMPNHFHLIVQTRHANLSEFMRQFLVTYTVRFNRHWNRTGHVFQGRFKSILVEHDEYMVPLSRYIHLNPIRRKGFQNRDAKTSRQYLSTYRWSSLAGYKSVGERWDIIEYAWLLETYFGGDTARGRRQYWRYVYEGIKGEIENPYEKVVHQSILGTESFVAWVKEKLTQRSEREIPGLRKLGKEVAVEKILEQIIKGKNIDRASIVKRKAETKVVRQMAMELCYRYSTLNQRELGEIFGVDYSTVSQNRARLKTRLRKDKSLRKVFDEMEGKIVILSK
jgi:REP element-mobilizing transposase RayT